HYGVMINFNGFIKVIDTLGGVTVNVPNGFSDYQFPNSSDTGYDPVHFNAGTQKMDGLTALKYARSRKGNNGEGSDYARARRQQIVMNAVKEEFMNSSLIKKADIANQMTSILGENVHFFNLGTQEFNMALESRDVLSQVQTFSMVIDPEFGSYTAHLLFGINKGNGAGFVVTPKDGDYSNVQALITLYLKHPYLISQEPKLRVIYSNFNRSEDYTQVKNLLYTNALQFERNNNSDYALKLGSVAGVSDSSTQHSGLETNENPTSSAFGVLYDVSDGTKAESLNFYKDFFKENGIVFEIKSKEQLPAELEKFLDDTDFIVLMS
ncbi:MAG: LCP family protein, partial [Candidatus Dojkabacteria bacterium]